MKRILFLLLIAFAFSPAVETIRSQSSGPRQDSRVNLTGIWDDAGDQVTITDSGGSVTARYSKQKQCRHDGSVTPYSSGFVVTGTGSTLTGTGTICYYGERDPESSAPRGVKQDSRVTLIVGPDGNTLAGTQVGYHGSISFTLTRKCKPDAGRLCLTINRAIGSVKDARVSAGSASVYQSLQRNLGSQIDQLRNDLCDNSEALRKLDEVRGDLDSLNYQSGSSNSQNNLKLGQIEQGLKDLAPASCVGGTRDSTLTADLSLTVTGSTPPVPIGTQREYILTVTNNGPVPAPGTVLTYILPAGMTLFSAVTPSQGRCTGASTITCTLGMLAKDASATVVFAAGPKVKGVFVSKAKVVSSVPDPDLSNNNDTITIRGQ